MQKLNARSDAGTDAKPEPRWDAGESDFVERGDRAGYTCSIAYDRNAGRATAAFSKLGTGCCGGSDAATATSASSQIDGPGGRCRDGDGDRTT